MTKSNTIQNTEIDTFSFSFDIEPFMDAFTEDRYGNPSDNDYFNSTAIYLLNGLLRTFHYQHTNGADRLDTIDHKFMEAYARAVQLFDEDSALEQPNVIALFELRNTLEARQDILRQTIAELEEIGAGIPTGDKVDEVVTRKTFAIKRPKPASKAASIDDATKDAMKKLVKGPTK